MSTTVLTTTLTTAEHPFTTSYKNDTTSILPGHAVRPCLRIRRLGFESLRAHPFSSTRQPLRFAGAEPPRMGDRRVSAVSPLIVRTPASQWAASSAPFDARCVPAAVLLATTVCLVGSTVTAGFPPRPK